MDIDIKYKGSLHDPSKVSKQGHFKVGSKNKYVLEIKKFLNWYYNAGLNDKNSSFGETCAMYVNKFKKEFGGNLNGQWGSNCYKHALNATKKHSVNKAEEEKPVDKFIKHLQNYHKYIKANGKYCRRKDPTASSLKTAKVLVKRKSKVNLNCTVCNCWAFAEMKIKPAKIYAVNGSFKRKFYGDMTKYLRRITSGKPTGMTLSEAVGKKLLKKGDFVCFKGVSHTCVYSGTKMIFFDAGSEAQKRGYSKVGILVDYSKTGYKNREISEILRWK